MDRICIVIGAAKDDLDREFLDRSIALRTDRKPYVYCADGGIHHARRLGLHPDKLIGDMDSAGDSFLEGAASGIAGEIIRLPSEKDETDLFACVKDGLEKGFRDFMLIFCTNGRIDHFMAAAAILEYLDERGATGVLLDSRNEIAFMKPGRIAVPKDTRFKYISIIPLDEELSGITLEGMKYPLTDMTVRRPDMCLLVSNETVGGDAALTIAKGRAMIIKSRDASK